MRNWRRCRLSQRPQNRQVTSGHMHVRCNLVADELHFRRPRGIRDDNRTDADRGNAGPGAAGLNGGGPFTDGPSAGDACPGRSRNGIYKFPSETAVLGEAATRWGAKSDRRGPGIAGRGRGTRISCDQSNDFAHPTFTDVVAPPHRVDGGFMDGGFMDGGFMDGGLVIAPGMPVCWQNTKIGCSTSPKEHNSTRSRVCCLRVVVDNDLAYCRIQQTSNLSEGVE